MIDFSSPKRYSVLCTSIFTPGDYREKNIPCANSEKVKKKKKELSILKAVINLNIFSCLGRYYTQKYILYTEIEIL